MRDDRSSTPSGQHDEAPRERAREYLFATLSRRANEAALARLVVTRGPGRDVDGVLPDEFLVRLLGRELHYIAVGHGLREDHLGSTRVRTSQLGSLRIFGLSCHSVSQLICWDE